MKVKKPCIFTERICNSIVVRLIICVYTAFHFNSVGIFYVNIPAHSIFGIDKALIRASDSRHLPSVYVDDMTADGIYNDFRSQNGQKIIKLRQIPVNAGQKHPFFIFAPTSMGISSPLWGILTTILQFLFTFSAQDTISHHFSTRFYNIVPQFATLRKYKPYIKQNRPLKRAVFKECGVR